MDLLFTSLLLLYSTTGFFLLLDRVEALVPRRDAHGFFVIGQYKSRFLCPRNKYGYYADVENGCRLFHICHPRTNINREPKQNLATNAMEQYSLVCPDGTIFDQLSLNCASIDQAVPCPYAVDFYFFNKNDTELTNFTSILEESIEKDHVNKNRSFVLAREAMAEHVISENYINETSRSLEDEHESLGILPADDRFESFSSSSIINVDPIIMRNTSKIATPLVPHIPDNRRGKKIIRQIRKKIEQKS